MKSAFCLFALFATTTASAAAPLIGGAGMAGGMDLKMLIGAGFGIFGVLVVAAFLMVTGSQKRKTQAVQLAYDTQLDAFRQSIRKGGSYRG
jgi:hypothetical protein